MKSLYLYPFSFIKNGTNLEDISWELEEGEISQNQAEMSSPILALLGTVPLINHIFKPKQLAGVSSMSCLSVAEIT